MIQKFVCACAYVCMCIMHMCMSYNMKHGVTIFDPHWLWLIIKLTKCLENDNPHYNCTMKPKTVD